jgi:hypothetical protein
LLILSPSHLPSRCVFSLKIRDPRYTKYAVVLFTYFGLLTTFCVFGFGFFPLYYYSPLSSQSAGVWPSTPRTSARLSRLSRISHVPSRPARPPSPPSSCGGARSGPPRCCGETWRHWRATCLRGYEVKRRNPIGFVCLFVCFRFPFFFSRRRNSARLSFLMKSPRPPSSISSS